MAFNNGFPASYQPLGFGNYPQYPQMQPPQMTGAQQMPQQMMTPPTIRAEIVQVDGEEAAGRDTPWTCSSSALPRPPSPRWTWGHT